MIMKPILVALLATTAGSAFAQSESNTEVVSIAEGLRPATAPVRSVVLYESGLAELTRVTGDSNDVTLRVPQKDIDDVLKSLLVRGPNVTGASISLSGSDPVGDGFAGLPFPPEALKDIAFLLKSVPGIRVETQKPNAASGEVVDVGEVCTDSEGCRTSVTILTDDGNLATLTLKDNVTLKILDEDILADMKTGLGVLRDAADGDLRDVTISLKGEGLDETALSYVIAAPAWKTAYRAVIDSGGTIDLRAWAVVENATGENWDDVMLTLSSGSPKTLKADLFSRDWRGREPFSPGDTAAPFKAQRMEIASDAGFGIAASGMAMAPVAPLESGTNAEDDDVASRFTFGLAQTVAAGDILSAPFLTDQLSSRKSVLWQGSLRAVTGHPELTMQVENHLDFRLPPGIVTLTDTDTGYVGDGIMPIVSPGEKVDVAYGIDRHLDIKENVSSETERTKLVLTRGVMTIKSVLRRETTYDVTNMRGNKRRLLIDHPLEGGWTQEMVGSTTGAVEGVERQDKNGDRWMRYDVAVEKAMQKPTEMEVIVVETMPTTEAVSLSTLDDETLLSYEGELGEADQLYLKKAITLRTKLAEALATSKRIDEDLQKVIADQDRMRLNLGAVKEETDVYAEYVGKLLDLDKRIEELRSLQDQADQAQSQARDDLNTHMTE